MYLSMGKILPLVPNSNCHVSEDWTFFPFLILFLIFFGSMIDRLKKKKNNYFFPGEKSENLTLLTVVHRRAVKIILLKKPLAS